MKNTLESRVSIFSFVILFLVIFVHSAMNVEGFRRDYIDALVLRSASLGISLKENVENVLLLGLELREVAGVGEKSRALVNANPDIAYCVVTDLEGLPLFLSDPAYADFRFKNIIRAVSAKNGRLAHLIVHDDTYYYDTVTRIKSGDGKLVAEIHVGFPRKALMARIKEMIYRSIFVLVLFVVIAFSLVVVFARRNIMQPVSLLLTGVKKIADGALDTRVQTLPGYELNEVANSINSMAESLQNRQEEVRKNYQELELTHEKLHGSYRRLEDLSRELKKSEELYKTLLEYSSDAILVVDGDETVTVRLANKMAEGFFGYHAKELEGLPLAKLLLLLNVSDIPRILAAISAAVDGNHVSEEMMFETRAGAQVVATFNASSVQSADRRLVQIIFRDVTKEKETLSNLEKSTLDLARLNKMKDSFLGLASHELKTPLTVIMGYSELILTEMRSKMDQTVTEMVENIAGAASRLDGIVKDMVDVSLIDEKRMQLKMEYLQVNRLIESSINELKFFFSLRRQDVVLHLDDSLPLVKADGTRLLQLFSNVMGNAMKFTPDGGRITVSTSAKYLLRSNQEGTARQEQCLYVEITVKDSGIGIDRDDQFRIFEKFFEVGNIEEHSSGKTAFKAKGAGLGLTIAKGIVEMHGGEIWVESPGYDPVRCPGSAFHIFLPVTPPEIDTPLNYINILK